MAEKGIADRLNAMKVELEQLGCVVNITPFGDDSYTVYIQYPPDVPPPTEQDDPAAPDGWYDDEDDDDG